MILGSLPFEPIYKPDGTIDKTATIKLPLTFDMIHISANPTIPASLENIIYRCLACKKNEIKHRYNYVDEIIEDVKKCLPLLDKKNDSTVLLKPVSQRLYQSYQLIDPDANRGNQKWYKHWYAFALFVGLGVAIIIVSIIFFFVI